MSTLRAHVENGRLVLDQPTGLPEGTVLDLVVDDEGDELVAEDRQALHDALAASYASVLAGDTRPAAEVLDRLRRR